MQVTETCLSNTNARKYKSILSKFFFCIIVFEWFRCSRTYQKSFGLFRKWIKLQSLALCTQNTNVAWIIDQIPFNKCLHSFLSPFPLFYCFFYHFSFWFVCLYPDKKFACDPHRSGAIEMVHSPTWHCNHTSWISSNKLVKQKCY